MAYQLILATLISEFYPESVGGVTPVMSHGLLSGLLASEISRDAALFLAEPSVKVRLGRIDWLTPLPGEVRDLAALAGAERDAAEDGLCLMAGGFAALGARLTGAESGERRLAGKLIARLAVEAASCAVGIGGARRVMVVGGVPVLAGWGLGTSAAAGAGAPGGHELTEEELRLVGRILAGERPRDFIPRTPGAMSAADAAPAPDPGPALPEPVLIGPAADGPEAAAPRRPRNWPKALLAALLAFLLAVLAVLLLDRDFRGVAARAGAPENRLPDESLEPGLRSELDGLRALYAAALAGCLAGDRPGRGPVPGSLGAPVPEARDGPGGSPSAPAPGYELTLPGDTEDLAFLNGCWKSDAGLHSFPEHLPFHYVYCFSEGSGTARVLLEETAADGTRARTCAAEGTASIEDGILVILDDGPKCDSGSNFKPVRVECVPGGGGAADCMYYGGRNPSRTRFTYVGNGR
ncbi:MAG: hypothetical protein LBQ79_14575 [Deltaproteobacteria bacterium]|jgi:hypothetical protein|nr:hypothetical protein [Deltaproteobacteria bacterium]